MAQKLQKDSNIPRRRTREVVSKIVAQLKKDKIDFQSVYLFGSQVTEYSCEDSDIDLCIVLQDMDESLFDQKKFEAIHSANMLRENIDVIVTMHTEFKKNMVSPILHEIRKTGILVS